MSTTQPLTEEQIVAMAAGVSLDEPEVKTEEKPVASDATGEKPQADASDALTVLTGMLATAQAETASLKLAVTEAEKRAQASNDAMKPFVDIARASVKTMGVALNTGLGDKVATMTDTEVLAEHTRLAGMFKEKFKAGGVAATAIKEDTKPQKAAELPLSFLVATTLKK